MRSFLVTTASLSLLASSALAESNSGLVTDWIEDRYSSCPGECLKDAIEDKLSNDCGDDVLSSRDADIIACVCLKLID